MKNEKNPNLVVRYFEFNENNDQDVLDLLLTLVLPMIEVSEAIEPDSTIVIPSESVIGQMPMHKLPCEIRIVASEICSYCRKAAHSTYAILLCVGDIKYKSLHVQANLCIAIRPVDMSDVSDVYRRRVLLDLKFDKA